MTLFKDKSYFQAEPHVRFKKENETRDYELSFAFYRTQKKLNPPKVT